MRLINVVVAAPPLSIVLLTACSGTSGGLSPVASNSSFSCSMKIGATAECYGYSNLTSDQASAQQSVCSAGMGTIVDSCPSEYVGCCSTTTDGYTFSECYYTGAASELRTSCAGTWTSGGGRSVAGKDAGSDGGGRLEDARAGKDAIDTGAPLATVSEYCAAR